MTNTLFSFIPNIVNFTQAKQIAELALHVYEEALEIYEQQSPPTSSQTGDIDYSKDVFTH